MRLKALSVLTALECVYVGCGSVASNTDASLPLSDAPQTDASLGPRCNPSQPFLNPTAVPNVNSPSDDRTPRLSADELEMFFASNRSGNFDLYVARRASREAEFGTPEPIGELNTMGFEYAPFLASDNLTLYYHPGPEIFVARRPSRTEPFSASAPVAGINGPQDESDPYIMQNDQLMYFTSNRNNVSYDIYRSTRDISGTFSTPTPVTEINKDTSVEGSPVVAADGLTIYWATDMGVAGVAEIWVATRPSTSAAFTSPIRHGTLNPTQTSFDVPGWVSADNCVIYISSNRSSGVGGTDIWVARRAL
jgi:Tol biopolymer transport system component